jgi:hypothetical protein
MLLRRVAGFMVAQKTGVSVGEMVRCLALSFDRR